LGSSIKEKIYPGEPPLVACQRAALEKAIYASRGLKEGLVLGCDTIVVLEGEILGKPKDREEAGMMLRKLSGKSHEVFSGLALLDLDDSQIFTDFERTVVYFKELEQKEVERYLDSSEPMGKAGAYAIQGKGALFVQRIEGCFYNVVGLPLYRLSMLLKKVGFE